MILPRWAGGREKGTGSVAPISPPKSRLAATVPVPLPTQREGKSLQGEARFTNAAVRKLPIALARWGA
jgi:hypothetical protein